VTVPPSIEECKAELWKAQRLLKSVKKRAQDLRTEFLLQTLDEATLASEDAREKAIRNNIVRNQEKLQSFACIQKIFKPTSQGGLSRLLIPMEYNNNEWETVTQPE
jgi:hypothetical protein